MPHGTVAREERPHDLWHTGVPVKPRQTFFLDCYPTKDPASANIIMRNIWFSRGRIIRFSRRSPARLLVYGPHGKSPMV